MEQVASDLAAEAGGEAMPVWGDVTDEAAVRRMAGEVRDRFGRIDVLVTNAGGDIGAGGTDVGRGGRPAPDDAVGIPLADIRATTRVRMVIKGGEVMETAYDPKWVNPIPRPGGNGR